MEKNKKSPKNINLEILSGKIFVYPTDTVYGIGCDATNISSVEKIKNLTPQTPHFLSTSQSCFIMPQLLSLISL